MPYVNPAAAVPIGFAILVVLATARVLFRS
jgi:hypothetical protein